MSFSQKLLTWFDQHGRKNLPWQNPRSAYFVWVSEIMLQQTQVTTVIQYFKKFTTRFPTLESLAIASLDEVLVHWAGLGYYSRARNLYRTAQLIQSQHQGRFPSNIDQLQALPGIGPSTAGAIVAQAFNEFAVILDGNVKRVLSRYHAIDGDPNDKATLKKLWAVATQHTPKKRIVDYTQAIMDLGAMICTRSKPRCLECPLMQDCQAFQMGTIFNFPNKKKAKKLPERTRFFMLLINRKKEILMERQPPIGIWGNLWSLPSAETHEEFVKYVSQKQLANKKTLKALDHRFTHFKLTMKPILMTHCPMKIQVSESSMQKWIPLDQINNLALPTPIKKILGDSKHCNTSDN